MREAIRILQRQGIPETEKGSGTFLKEVEFHQAIANCSGNLVIHNLIPYIHQSQMLTDVMSVSRGKHSTVKEHRKIVEAIEHRRGADAYDSMLFHLNKIQEKTRGKKGDSYGKNRIGLSY